MGESVGGRTDLVFQEPVNTDKAARASEGLVLREWKVAKNDAEISKAFEEARAQADIYAGGVLSGLELAGYRYLVIVTEKQAPPAAILETAQSNGVVKVCLGVR